MRSSTEPRALGPPASCSQSGGRFRRWNRRLHYYLGLYLLFFVWLFAFTGLLLNHSQWKFAQFWDSRRQTAYEREIAAPPPGGDLAQAGGIMRQLAIRGEIEWTTTRDDANRFDFRVSRPGHMLDIKADLARKRASVQRIDLNGWGCCAFCTPSPACAWMTRGTDATGFSRPSGLWPWMPWRPA